MNMGKNIIKPVVITGITLSIIILLIIVYIRFEFHIQKFLWNINRPATYYVELVDASGGNRWYSSIIVSEGVVVNPGNANISTDTGIFTLDALYEQAYTAC